MPGSAFAVMTSTAWVCHGASVVMVCLSHCLSACCDSAPTPSPAALPPLVPTRSAVLLAGPCLPRLCAGQGVHQPHASDLRGHQQAGPSASRGTHGPSHHQASSRQQHAPRDAAVTASRLTRVNAHARIWAWPWAWVGDGTRIKSGPRGWSGREAPVPRRGAKRWCTTCERRSADGALGRRCCGQAGESWGAHHHQQGAPWRRINWFQGGG